MSKVLIDRAVLEATLEHAEFVSGAACDADDAIRAVLDTPSGTPVMPVKAYYHESPNEHGGLNKSVGLEVRKTFIDTPLVLESDALVQIACLEGEIAKRDARIVELERSEKNDAIAYKAALERQDDLRTELAALKAQEPVAWTDGAGAMYSASLMASLNISPGGLTPLYASPVSEAKAQDFEPLVCDYCNAETQDPWHGSGMLNGVESRHIHACSQCRNLLPTAKALAVVMPPSPYMPGVEPAQLSDYERGEAQGRCDMWEEVARLNAALAAPAADAVNERLEKVWAGGSAAPSPAGVDGLEVVGWRTKTGSYTEDGPSAEMRNARGIGPYLATCYVSDAQAIIDGLRGEVDRLDAGWHAANVSALVQAQRVGELEWLLRDVAGMFRGPGIE